MNHENQNGLTRVIFEYFDSHISDGLLAVEYRLRHIPRLGETVFILSGKVGLFRCVEYVHHDLIHDYIRIRLRHVD
jgi:hypothetical protein